MSVLSPAFRQNYVRLGAFYVPETLKVMERALQANE